MTQEELKAKADAYIGHPYELGEDASVTSQREAYIKGCEDTQKDALNAHADYWYWRLREIASALKEGQDISVTGEIVKFRNQFKNHD